MTRLREVRLLSGLLLLLLAGCAAAEGPVRSLRPDAVFTPASPAAIAAVGLQASAQTEATTGLAATWRRYDPQSQLLLSGEETTLIAVRDFWSDADDPGRTRLKYHFQALRPGSYILASVTQYQGALGRLTTLFEHDADAEGRLLTPVSVAGVASHRFRVAPGEIVYLGDLLADVAAFPARLLFKRSDEGAQAALRRFPGVQGEMVFRPPLEGEEGLPGRLTRAGQ